MPKEFFTEKDIEDLVRRGVTSLEVSENTVLTELAYEKAGQLGMHLLQAGADTPPAAPIRPYLSQVERPMVNAAKPAYAPLPPAPSLPAAPAAALPADLQNRIRQAVTARLGSQVDPRLLDVIIQRVLASTGVK